MWSTYHQAASTAATTVAIAAEVAFFNAKLKQEGRPYLLLGTGPLGQQ
jgi:hypothetical protein